MRAYDFSPFYRTASGRSTLGFDQVANMLDNLVGLDQSKTNYPPYNIEQKSEDAYRISLAVAGFDQSELSIEAERNQLTVSGKKTETENEESNYLYRGIAARNFVRRFELANYVRVQGATYRNGLLHIDLVREIPEVMKPRTISINDGNVETVQSDAKQLDNQVSVESVDADAVKSTHQDAA